MGLTLGLRLETRVAMIQAMELVGGATTSIFPEAEALLLENKSYWRAIKFVLPPWKVNRAKKYKSVMDFLLCELYPEWRSSCFRFYRDDGPPLKELLTPEQVVAYGRRLVKALEVARDLFRKKQRRSWNNYRRQVQVLSRAA